MAGQKDLKSMIVEMMKNLTCEICQDILTEPKDLDCGHTYCLECLRQLVTKEEWTSDIKCCLCIEKKTSIPSTGLDSLKKNKKLICILKARKSLVDKIEALYTDGETTDPEATAVVQIWVCDTKGDSKSCFIRLSDTADALKRWVANALGIPLDAQRLIFQGKQLIGSKTLKEYDVMKCSTINLTLTLKGGNMTP